MSRPSYVRTSEERRELRGMLRGLPGAWRVRALANVWACCLTLVFIAIWFIPYAMVLGLGAEILSGSSLRPWVLLLATGSYLALLVRVYIVFYNDRLDDSIRAELDGSNSCFFCGYDLAGVPAAADGVRCPECGVEAVRVDPAGREHPRGPDVPGGMDAVNRPPIV